MEKVEYSDEVNAFGEKGKAFRQEGNLNSAVDCFKLAIEQEPDHFWHYHLLGCTLEDMGALDQAIPVWERALECSHNPNFFWAYHRLALAHEKKGENDKAVAYLHQAISTQPDRHEPYFILSRLYRKIGKLKTGNQEKLGIYASNRPDDFDFEAMLERMSTRISFSTSVLSSTESEGIYKAISSFLRNEDLSDHRKIYNLLLFLADIQSGIIIENRELYRCQEKIKEDIENLRQLLFHTVGAEKCTAMNIYDSTQFLRQKIEFLFLNLEGKFDVEKEILVTDEDDMDDSEFRNDHFGIYGKRSQDNVSIVGRDGWIFIESGSNDLMDYQVGRKTLSQDELSQWISLLKLRQQWFQNKKINYIHLIVPNKISIYPEFYPAKISSGAHRPAIQLSKKLDFVSYPLGELMSKKSLYRLYDKQNSHWNFWGCYFTYVDTCQLLGLEPNAEIIHKLQTVIQREKVELGEKHNLGEWLVREVFPLSSEIAYDNGVRHYAHQGSVFILKNDNPNVIQKKMIIFGDSFSVPIVLDKSGKVHQEVHRLSTLFAETVAEVHFVWMPWIDFKYIEREKPDFVITEMVERFLKRIPEDHYSGQTIEEFSAEILARESSNKI